MPYLIHTDTAVDNNNVITLYVDVGKSINQCKKIIFKKLGIDDFTNPTICLLNGKPLLRKYWSTKLKENDHVAFSANIGFTAAVGWALAASVAISVASTVLLKPNVDVPTIGGSAIPEPDPVYNIRGQRNRNRPNEVIEEVFGRCRLFPSVASRSYTKYVNNEQIIYSLFSLGIGEFEIETPMIDDTPVTQYRDFNYYIYKPKDSITIFRDNVETSSEVSNIELFAPNDDNYDGYSGWYVANKVNTLCDKLEFDIVYPDGLFEQKDNGTLSSVFVRIQIHYQKIDDEGNAIGPITYTNFTKNLNEITPQRFTYVRYVTPARYRVRARRSTYGSDDIAKKEKVVWESLRAFLPNVGTYSDVTTIATIAKANSMTGNASGILNVFTTRKLPIYNGTNWTDPVATRSAVWAFCYILRSDNGAKIESDKYFRMDALLETEEILKEEGRNFDWVFDSNTTVWQALQLISRAVRGFPIIQGYTLNLKLERPQEIPIAIFNEHNIVKDSLEWNIKLKSINEYNGFSVEYTNPDDWKTETVNCYTDDSEGDYLKNIKLPGVTDRDLAYKEGMYEQMKKLYVAENITFVTGLEGNIPEIGDLIQVSHQLPEWGQGGRILSIDGNTITTDKDVQIDENEEYILQIKTKNGEASSYYNISLGDNSRQIITDTDIDIEQISLEDGCENSIYILGKKEEDLKLIVVNEIEQTGEEMVKISGFNYDNRVFSYD